MQQHYVTFYSPGTFVSEENVVAIDSWNVNEAIAMARTILQRYNATPYGFKFTTRSRKDDELDSKTTDHSPIYYLGGTIETVEEIEARNDPKERILLSNMKNNGYDKVIVNTNSWKFTGFLREDDIVLDFVPETVSE